MKMMTGQATNTKHYGKTDKHTNTHTLALGEL